MKLILVFDFKFYFSTGSASGDSESDSDDKGPGEESEDADMTDAAAGMDHLPVSHEPAAGGLTQSRTSKRARSMPTHLSDFDLGSTKGRKKLADIVMTYPPEDLDGKTLEKISAIGTNAIELELDPGHHKRYFNLNKSMSGIAVHFRRSPQQLALLEDSRKKNFPVSGGSVESKISLNFQTGAPTRWNGIVRTTSAVAHKSIEKVIRTAFVAGVFSAPVRSETENTMADICNGGRVAPVKTKLTIGSENDFQDARDFCCAMRPMEMLTTALQSGEATAHMWGIGTTLIVFSARPVAQDSPPIKALKAHLLTNFRKRIDSYSTNPYHQAIFNLASLATPTILKLTLTQKLVEAATAQNIDMCYSEDEELIWADMKTTGIEQMLLNLLRKGEIMLEESGSGALADAAPNHSVLDIGTLLKQAHMPGFSNLGVETASSNPASSSAPETDARPRPKTVEETVNLLKTQFFAELEYLRGNKAKFTTPEMYESEYFLTGGRWEEAWRGVMRKAKPGKLRIMPFFVRRVGSNRAASVNSERFFSMLGQTYGKLRTRISPETLEATSIVRSHLRSGGNWKYIDPNTRAIVALKSKARGEVATGFCDDLLDEV